MADAQHLPQGRHQAGDRHLKFHETRDNLVWAYSKDYGIPCLAHFGIKPDEPLPTRETYIATRGRFYLYPLNAQVPDTVQSACPQLPPTRAMFGLR